MPGAYAVAGRADFAVYRPAEGRWYIQGQPSVQWGTSIDIPVAEPAAVRLVHGVPPGPPGVLTTIRRASRGWPALPTGGHRG